VGGLEEVPVHGRAEQRTAAGAHVVGHEGAVEDRPLTHHLLGAAHDHLGGEVAHLARPRRLLLHGDQHGLHADHVDDLVEADVCEVLRGAPVRTHGVHGIDQARAHPLGVELA